MKQPIPYRRDDHFVLEQFGPFRKRFPSTLKSSMCTGVALLVSEKQVSVFVQKLFFSSMQVLVVVGSDGEPWFVANDVCAALGIYRTQIRRLDDDEKGLRYMHTPGGDQKILIINEPGLYHLTITSRKDFAKRFRKWLTGDIAPTIRKHGVYATHDAIEKAA